MGSDQRKKLRVKPVKGVTITSNSSYQIAFTYKGDQRERVKLKPSDANTRYMNNLKQKIKEAIAKDEFRYEDFFPESKRIDELASDPASLITIEQYFDDYMNSGVAECCSYSGWSTTKRAFMHGVRALGHLKLSELTPVVVYDWLEDMRLNKNGVRRKQTLAHVTLKKRLSAFHAAIKRAPKKLLPVDPLLGFVYEKPMEKRDTVDEIKDVEKGMNKPKHNAFDKAEQNKILLKSSGQIHNYIKYNFWSGLRPQEMIAVQWPDVDFDEGPYGTVLVWRTRTEATPIGKFEKPKTDAGFRKVPLNEHSRAALLAQQEYTLELGKEIFHDPKTDLPYRHSGYFLKHWKEVLESAGVRYRDPYQMRHTFASIMLDLSENHEEAGVSNAMGHNDVHFTRKQYYDYIQGDDTKNVVAFASEKIKAKQAQEKLW